MNQYKVTIIPRTNPENANKFMGIPGKKRVVGYSRVFKGSGAGLKIRKNIRQLIKDKPYWELDYVTTDHKNTGSQESTWSRFLNICHRVKYGYIDILIIHSDSDFEEALNAKEWLLEFCKFYGVDFYIAHKGLLLSEEDFML